MSESIERLTALRMLRVWWAVARVRADERVVEAQRGVYLAERALAAAREGCRAERRRRSRLIVRCYKAGATWREMSMALGYEDGALAVPMISQAIHEAGLPLRGKGGRRPATDFSWMADLTRAGASDPADGFAERRAAARAAVS